MRDARGFGQLWHPGAHSREVVATVLRLGATTDVYIGGSPASGAPRREASRAPRLGTMGRRRRPSGGRPAAGLHACAETYVDLLDDGLGSADFLDDAVSAQAEPLASDGAWPKMEAIARAS